MVAVNTVTNLEWAGSSNDPANLLAPIIVDFEVNDEYDITPSGSYTPSGTNRYADGLIVDNLMNGFPITVSVGLFVEVVPAYQKSTIGLNQNSPIVIVTGSGIARLTFFTGIYKGSTIGTNTLEAYKLAVIQSRVGVIDMWPGLPNNIPAGTLLCVGTEVSRSVYSDLFSIVGIRYGAGDGVTTFNLPNFSRRMPVGADTTGTRNLAATGGAETVALTANQNGVHSHGITDSGHSHGVSDPGHNHTATASNDTHTHTGTTSSDTHSHTGTTSTDTHSHTFSAYNHSESQSTFSAGGSRIFKVQAEDADTLQTQSTSSDAHNHTFTTSSNTHSHTLTLSSDTHTHTVTIATRVTGLTVNTVTTGITINNSGTGAAHENMPPWLGVYFIIWTGTA